MINHEIKKKVIDGGDLDISVTIFDPTGKKIGEDIQQEDGLHPIDTAAGGDFKFCFDNSFSRMSEKVKKKRKS